MQTRSAFSAISRRIFFEFISNYSISHFIKLLIVNFYYFFFPVEESWLNKTTVALVCEGLDTIAEVIINGIQIGISTNMFRSYTWDVKKALISGTNEIKIVFTSAVTYSASKSKQYPYPIPPACPPPVQQGECHVNLIRKKQCSFSWVSSISVINLEVKHVHLIFDLHIGVSFTAIVNGGAVHRMFLLSSQIPDLLDIQPGYNPAG